MPTNAGRIIFIDHARTGQSINTLSVDIQDNNLVPHTDSRLRFINLLYKTKHVPPFYVWGAPLMANIPVEDAQMERLDLATVGRVTPYYCSLYWEDNWEEIPYPDKPGAQAILDQVSARAATWAMNPPPIPPSLTQATSLPTTSVGGARSRPQRPPLLSPFERPSNRFSSTASTSGQGSSAPGTSRLGLQQLLNPFEWVLTQERERGQVPPSASSSGTASGYRPLRRLDH